MTATVLHIHNPLQPHRGVDRHACDQTLTISEVLSEFDIVFTRPTICLVNGEAVLRDQWSELQVSNGDLVIFAGLMGDGGDGGSSPLKIVAMIALVVVANVYGAQLGAAFGLTGSVASGVGAGLISMVGGALISAAFPPPDLPSSQKTTALAAPSPTYNLQAQGNSARLGEPIPVWYGRHLIYPDFAAMPYMEYQGNEQYLYQLFCVGQGSYQIEEIRIEDTPIASFAEITTEIVGPGGTVTLFPTDVISSVEVSGQELLTNVTVGPFIANPSGTISDKFAIDIVCPKGLYFANDAGGLDALTVSWRVEYQQVDDAGVPLGNWIVAANETYTRATNTPQRKSYEYAVAVGRYQVRLTRTNAKNTASRAANDLNWAGMRAYIPGDQQYGDVTIIAMKMRATNNLSQQSSRKVNITATRELPIWSTAGGWTAPQTTRNPAWAIADAAIATYGGNMLDSQINLPALETLASTWETRGDYFDGGFDQQLVLMEALSLIGKVGRARPYLQAGMLQTVRDQPVTMPAASFCSRNILAGDISLDYHTPTADTPDEVIVEYFDADTWSYKTVSSDLTGATALKPYKMSFFGITNRDQAYREAMFFAACNRYRRKTGSFPVELEGHLLSLLDLAEITHDLISWGQSGDVLAWDQATNTLTLSEELTWDIGDHYISMRGRNGRQNGPWLTTPGAENNQVIVAAGLGTFVPDTDPAVREPTFYQFGLGNKRAQEYRVLGIRPQSENRITLEVVNENPLVHTADQSPVPDPLLSWNLTKQPTKPVMSPISVVQGGSVEAPILHISWAPVRGADHYLIQQSADNFAWTDVGNPVNSEYQLAVAQGYVYLRVMAVGLTASDPVYWQGTAGPLAPPGDVQNLILVGDADGKVRKISWDKAPRATGYIVEVWADGIGRRSETINDTTYSYSVDDALSDGGPWRLVTFQIKAVGIFGNSDNWVSLITNNPPPDLSGNTPLVTPVLKGLLVDWSAISSNDRDLLKYKIYCDTNNPPVALKGEVGAETTTITIPDLDTSLAYYVQVEPLDSFGVGIASEVSGGTPNAIAAADVNVELSAAIKMTDSDGNSTATLDKLYDRNTVLNGVGYTIASGTDKWIQYEYGLENYIDKVIVHAADALAQVYIAYSVDGVAWNYLKAEADHSTDADGNLLPAVDTADAAANYWQLAAGRNEAVFPQRITAKFCRIFLTGAYSTELYELVFDRLIIAETVVADELASISSRTGVLYSDNYVPGAAGYKLDGSGNLAEFNDMTIRVQSWAAAVNSVAGDAPAANADSTQTALEGGTTITSGGLTVAPPTFDAVNRKYTTIKDSSIQLNYRIDLADTTKDVMYQGLNRLEFGIAVNGVRTRIDGYFVNKPNVICLPADLMCYSAAGGASVNQAFKLDALNVLEYDATGTTLTPGSMMWFFEPEAKLVSAAGDKTDVYATATSGSANVFTPWRQSSATNVNGITISTKVKSSRGTATSATYYKRQARFKLHYSADGVNTTASSAWSTYYAIPNGGTTATIAAPRLTPAEGRWYARVEVEFSDAGGTYTSGNPLYDYKTVNVVVPVTGSATRTSYTSGTKDTYLSWPTSFAALTNALAGDWKYYTQCGPLYFGWSASHTDNSSIVHCSTYGYYNGSTPFTTNPISNTTDGNWSGSGTAQISAAALGAMGQGNNSWPSNPNLRIRAKLAMDTENSAEGTATISTGTVTVTLPLRRIQSQSTTASNTVTEVKIVWDLATVETYDSTGVVVWFASGT